ncbi:MAG: hypothetical protein WC389_22880 [Lutibacter sp.]|jgi:hypothetical protein
MGADLKARGMASANAAALAEMSQYVARSVVVTQAEYDALPSSKLTDTINYQIEG